MKYLKNNFVIFAIIFISSILTTLLYCLKSGIDVSLLYFFQNEVLVLGSIALLVICNSVFLLAVDNIFCRNVKFKERFFYIMKSLWISQFLLLPVILVLLAVNIFVDLKFLTINNIVVFTISYLSQIALVFSYKFVTNKKWYTTIKVIASQGILMFLITTLLKII